MEINDQKITDNHTIVKNWVIKYKGIPAMAEGVVPDGKAGEMLRIDFLDNSEGQLYEITWKQFFEIFDEHNLEFLYHDHIMDGERRPKYKLVEKRIKEN